MWLHIYMGDICIPYHNIFPVGEDNSVAQIIAHAGKLTPHISSANKKYLAYRIKGIVR